MNVHGEVVRENERRSDEDDEGSSAGEYYERPKTPNKRTKSREMTTAGVESLKEHMRGFARSVGFKKIKLTVMASKDAFYAMCLVEMKRLDDDNIDVAKRMTDQARTAFVDEYFNDFWNSLT